MKVGRGWQGESLYFGGGDCDISVRPRKERCMVAIDAAAAMATARGEGSWCGLLWADSLFTGWKIRARAEVTSWFRRQRCQVTGKVSS